jgi:hypothetical protein
MPPMRMNLGKKVCRVLERVSAAALLLSSCAYPGANQRRPSAVSPAPRPVTKVAQPSAKTESIPKASTKTRITAPPASRKELTKAEQIIVSVREGYLTESGKGTLVFSKAKRADSPGTGLFEDAILLGRLRHVLKETGGVPDSTLSSATVRDARAFLDVNAVSGAAAARVIDAALRTQGINSVQVQVRGEAS